MDLFELTKALVNIPSVTGSESALADFLVTFLRKRGFDVREQVVERKRRNVFAAAGPKPGVVLCTHMDTVPGPAVASEDGEYIYGRGSCDAKGIMSAMIVAACALLEERIQSVGLLFVVGEETDSLGARRANALDPGSRFIIVGEPTGNKLASGHKGILTIRLSTQGRKAHSAFPHLGESAVTKLLDCLQIVRSLELGEDPALGTNLMNIGRIEGGVAPNVIPDAAEAVISYRTAVAPDQVLARIIGAVGKSADIKVITQSDPQILHTVPGFEQAVMSFGSDIPHLKAFGKPLLIGPGSALDAHTESEKIEKKSMLEAVDIYRKLVKALMAEI
jgi:acetylornithine deacetylase